MSETRDQEVIEPRRLADWLPSRGQHWITTGEAAEVLGMPIDHVSPTLARWRRNGQLFSPTKGGCRPERSTPADTQLSSARKPIP